MTECSLLTHIESFTLLASNTTVFTLKSTPVYIKVFAYDNISRAMSVVDAYQWLQKALDQTYHSQISAANCRYKYKI